MTQLSNEMTSTEISDRDLDVVSGGNPVTDAATILEGMFGSGGFVQVMVEKAKAAMKGKPA